MDNNKTPLHAVDSLDLARYAGQWYEIARLPTRFEDDCASDVTATYTLSGNGMVSVVNACRNASGDIMLAEGTARLAEEQGPASKLKVSFVTNLLQFLPFVWADYWVIDLDPDYQYSVVSEPDRSYLWILCRTPEMEDTTFQAILQRLDEMGFDLTDIIKTRHTASQSELLPAA